MTPDTQQRDELLASARAALALEQGEIDRAHERFLARLDADAQRGAWRNTTELRPFVATWLRTIVLGLVGVSVIALGWWRCPLHEQSVAHPREHFDPAEPRR